MNLEWIVTGMILFGGMTAAGISLYIKRRKEQASDLIEATDAQPDLADFGEDEK